MAGDGCDGGVFNRVPMSPSRMTSGSITPLRLLGRYMFCQASSSLVCCPATNGLCAVASVSHSADVVRSVISSVVSSGW